MDERERQLQAQQLGAKIREARKAAGLTQHELASRIGVRERTFVRWENGQHLPSNRLAVLHRIAEATGQPLEGLEVDEEAAA